MSRGTLRSGLEMAKGGDSCTRTATRGRHRRRLRASFDFPEPIGRQPMARYPSGEVITVPRHTRTKPVVAMVTGAYCRGPPAGSRRSSPPMPRACADAAARRSGSSNRAIGALPEGPAEARPEGGRSRSWPWRARERLRSAQASYAGADVYGLTAVTLGGGGERMSAPGYDRAGALAPAAAFDPEAFLKYLGDQGVDGKSWRALTTRGVRRRTILAGHPE